MGTSVDMSVEPVMSVEFEIFGKVQGVYYTKCCCDYAHKVNVFGWVKNSKKGTIVGKMQGRKNKIEKMTYWLANKGSPDSVVENCLLFNVEYILKPAFNDFEIRF